MVRGACWAAVYGVIKSRTQVRMHTLGCFWWAGKSPNWSIKDRSGGSIFNFHILIQLSRVAVIPKMINPDTIFSGPVSIPYSCA